MKTKAPTKKHGSNTKTIKQPPTEVSRFNFRFWCTDESGKKLMFYTAPRECDVCCQQVMPFPINHPDNNDVVRMQSTGMIDSTGKEIYEGDIVGIDWIGVKSFGVVMYVPPSFIAVSFSCVEEAKSMKTIGFGNCWYHGIDRFASSPETEIVVLGNMYENPELLDEKDV